MLKKDSNKIESLNRVITPEIVFDAFNNLPFNYLTQTQTLLSEWFNSGLIKKNFSKRFIWMVRHNEKDAFNEIVCRALVEVGLKNKESKQLFSKRAKAPSTN